MFRPQDFRKVIKFLTVTIKTCADKMKLEDLATLKTTLTTIYNDKQRADQAKKKKGAWSLGPACSWDRCLSF